jgi:hypothetical protein
MGTFNPISGEWIEAEPPIDLRVNPNRHWGPIIVCVAAAIWIPTLLILAYVHVWGLPQ